MEDELINKSTKMAHLLNTHPETDYNGKLYADSLGLRYNNDNFSEKYEEELSLLEDEIRSTANGLNGYRPSKISRANLDEEVENMLEEAEKLDVEEFDKYQMRKDLDDVVKVVGGLAGQVMGELATQLGDEHPELEEIAVRLGKEYLEADQ